MPEKKGSPHSGEDRTISRRKFLGVTAGATAALSFGTFIRSGLGAAKVNVLTWSNTLRAMDDVLREQAKEYTKAKGVEVSFEFINQTDLPAKTAAAVESGAGPDVITLWSNGPHLSDKALSDVSDVSGALGKESKGWTNIAKDIAIVGKTWKAVPWGIIPIALTYREDWLKEVGYSTFPDTWDELLVASKKLKDKGHPVGFSLGRAIGDANQFHYPLLWAFGGAKVKKDSKTVAINSPETAKAADYRRKLYQAGETEDVFAWDDAANNRAFLASQEFPCRNMVRGALLLPWIVPTSLSVLTWLWMFDSLFSVVNYILLGLGLLSRKIPWLGDPFWAMMSVIIVNMWRGLPFFAVSILAGLMTIPRKLYEAAEIDGARAPRQFWHITLPLLQPVIAVVVLFSTIWTFADFQIVYILTHGGPINATQIFATMAYDVALVAGRIGEGSAISLFLFPALLVVIILLLRYLRRE